MTDSQKGALTRLLSKIPDTWYKGVGSATYLICAAAAAAIGDTEDAVAERLEKLDPSKLEGSELDVYVLAHAGIGRRRAQHATAELTVYGTGEIEAGDIFETETGVQFAADAASSIDGEGRITCTAVDAGDAGNAEPDTITVIPIPIEGIERVTNGAAATGGTDREDDAKLFDRFCQRIGNISLSGNAANYEAWALECSGVGDARCIPCADGPGTVTLIITGEDGGPADEELVDRVQRIIDPNSAGLGYGAAPIGAKCTVRAASERIVNITGKFVAEEGYTDVAERIEDMLQQAFTGLRLGDRLKYSAVLTAVSAAEGVLDFEVLADGEARTITPAVSAVLRLGTVTMEQVNSL